MLKRTRAAAVVSLVLAVAVVVGPLLLRRDRIGYAWAGAIGAGLLEQPIGVVYANGRLYVTDAGANRIVVLDTSGAVIGRWDGGALGLRRPMHIALGSDGHFYVAEYAGDRISVVDSAGRPVRRIGGAEGTALGDLDAPGGATVRGDTVFAADFYNHRVQAFSPRGVMAIGRPGRWLAARLHYPTDVATDDSLLYVADAYNNRIQVFRPNGDYVRRWGGPLGSGIPGPFKGWFRVATGVEAAWGRVYVADFYNNRIQIFTKRGGYLGQVADSLELPTDVSAGPGAELYVVDFGHKRVVRLMPIASSVPLPSRAEHETARSSRAMSASPVSVTANVREPLRWSSGRYRCRAACTVGRTGRAPCQRARARRAPSRSRVAGGC